MSVLFSFVLVLLNRTQVMMKECSSATALQTNGAYLTLMQNIRADIKYFANCHCGFISFDVFFILFFLFFRIAGCYPEVWILGTLMQRRFNSLLFMSVGDNLLRFCTLLFDFLDYIFL